MTENQMEFKVKFRGSRGSHPILSEDRLEFGGNTSCVEVNVNGHLIIIDAGTGLINLGNDLMKSHIASGTSKENREPVNVTMLISHIHIDHIQGFPFFKPAFVNSSKINIFGPCFQGLSFEETLTNFMLTPYFPINLNEMQSSLHVSDLQDSNVIVLHPGNSEPEIVKVEGNEIPEFSEDDVVITTLRSLAHPRDGVYMFRISYKGKSVVYATDKESYIGVDRKLTSFARNADVLIHDTQYTMDDYISPVSPKQGFGHSTPEMAIEAAKQSNVENLVLFHIDPMYDDEAVNKMEESAQKLFANTRVAKENLEINLL